MHNELTASTEMSPRRDSDQLSLARLDVRPGIARPGLFGD
jgi:hypothetical protein